MKIHSAALRLLLALCLATQQGQTPSVRDLCRMLGRDINTVHQRLVRLRQLGLVTWEYGRGRTLRPLVRLIVEP